MSSIRLLAIGEVMAEIRTRGDGFAVGFAGDSYNTAVYAARCLGEAGSVAYKTRIGRDPLSRAFMDHAGGEGLDVSLVSFDAGRNIGIYAVATDAAVTSAFAAATSAFAASASAFAASAAPSAAAARSAAAVASA